MSVKPERSHLLSSILQVIQAAKQKAYRNTNAHKSGDYSLSI